MPPAPDGWYWNVNIAKWSYDSEPRIRVVCYQRPITTYGAWRHRKWAKSSAEYWLGYQGLLTYGYGVNCASSEDADENARRAVRMADTILRENFPSPAPPRSLNGLVGYGVPEID